jgi:hypothetical protein
MTHREATDWCMAAGWPSCRGRMQLHKQQRLECTCCQAKAAQRMFSPTTVLYARIMGQVALNALLSSMPVQCRHPGNTDARIRRHLQHFLRRKHSRKAHAAINSSLAAKTTCSCWGLANMLVPKIPTTELLHRYGYGYEPAAAACSKGGVGRGGKTLFQLRC